MTSCAKKRKLVNKYDPTNLFLEAFNYDASFEKEKSIDTTKKVIKKNLEIYLTCQH